MYITFSKYKTPTMFNFGLAIFHMQGDGFVVLWINILKNGFKLEYQPKGIFYHWNEGWDFRLFKR